VSALVVVMVSDVLVITLHAMLAAVTAFAMIVCCGSYGC
jgi:hypothetical protein